MAGQGTGLPAIGGDPITPLVDMQGAARPWAELAADAADTVKVVAEAADAVIDDVAKRDAEARAAAEDFERRPLWHLGSTAYNEAITKAHGDRIDVKTAGRQEEIRLRNLYDPDGYSREMDELKLEMVEDAPREVVLALAQAFDRRASTGLSRVQAARLESELAEAKGAAIAREEMLNRRVLDAIARGDLDEGAIRSGEAAGDMADWDANLDDFTQNPAFEISPEQSALMRQRRIVQWVAELNARAVVKAYREEGPDAGFAMLQGFARSESISQAERDATHERASKLLGDEFTIDTRRRIIVETSRTEAAQQTRSLIEAMRYQGDVDPDALRAAAAASGDPGLIAEANYAIEVGVAPPGGLTGTAGFDGDPTLGTAGFDGWAAFFIQAEGGDATIEDDNGRGVSRWGINQTANPDLDVRNLSKPQALARLKSHYWNAIGADRLPPALAFVAADAAAVAGVGKAREWIDKSGGDVGRFLALQEGHYRALAVSSPIYADDLNGWMNRLNRARGYAARIESSANFQEGFATDPIKFAMGGPNRPALAAVPSLSLMGAFGGEGAPGWQQAIRQREAVGTTLARRYQVPMRMLSDSEAAAYKAQFAEDPARAVLFARSAVQALGPERGRALLREVGAGGVAIHIADLAATGSGPFAESAIEGMRLRDQKVKPAPYVTDEETVDQVARSYAPAFSRFPGLLSSVIETAELARLADSANGRARPARYYVNSALGAVSSNGRVFGGVGTLNGRQVILPNWLRNDGVDEVLETLADILPANDRAPVFSNGKPMPESEIRRLQFVALPNGHFGLVRNSPQGPAVVRQRDGKPFEVRIDGPEFRREFRRRHPDLVRGR